VHFLCLEPRETDKNVLKFTENLVLKFHFLLLGALDVLLSDDCVLVECRVEETPVQILKKLFFFSMLMIMCPLATYFISKSLIFEGHCSVSYYR